LDFVILSNLKPDPFEVETYRPVVLAGH